jgi:hypothetical protein
MVHLINCNNSSNRCNGQKRNLQLILNVCQTEFRFSGSFVATTKIACCTIAFEVGLIDCSALRIPAYHHQYRSRDLCNFAQEVMNLVHKIVSCTFSELGSGALAQKAGNPSNCRADLDAVHSSLTSATFKGKWQQFARFN